MNQLDENLSYIYLSEDLSSFLSSVRNKFGVIASAFKSKNHKVIASALKEVPAVKTPDDIVKLGKMKLKNFDKYYKEGNRYTHGNNTDSKKILSSVYATLRVAEENSPNEKIRSNFDSKITKFVEYLDDVPEAAMGGGVTFVIGSEILKVLLEDYKGQNEWFETILTYGSIAGFLSLAIGIILVIIKFILLTYLKIKGIEVDQT
jgi:hypothetical protein